MEKDTTAKRTGRQRARKRVNELIDGGKNGKEKVNIKKQI